MCQARLNDWIDGRVRTAGNESKMLLLLLFLLALQIDL